MNIDVEMEDIDCKFISVKVKDSYGEHALENNRENEIRKYNMASDHGEMYAAEEIAELESHQRDNDIRNLELSVYDMEEMDSDWESSTDGFAHTSLDDVIEYHDILVVNYFASWCIHCRQFAPDWRTFEDWANTNEWVSMNENQRPLRIRAIRVNCVDFNDACTSQRIRGFPSVIMYVTGGVEPQKVEFTGNRDTESLKEWMQQEFEISRHHKMEDYHDFHYHRMFNHSCRIQATVQLPRVPGTFVIAAESATKDHTIDFTYFNASHHIHHLSFGPLDYDTLYNIDQKSVLSHSLMPVDQMYYNIEQFHATKVHYLKIVPTLIESDNTEVYQIRHYANQANVMRNQPPQVKFSYEFSPVQVTVRDKERKWYDFLTSMVGIFGGTFAVMGLVSWLFFSAQRKVQNTLGAHTSIQMTVMGKQEGRMRIVQESKDVIPTTIYQ